MVNYEIAYADETRVQVLKEPDKPPESQSYMWCFIGGALDSRSVIYHYDPGRAHTVLENMLEGFSGYLHCDGYVGYDTYASDHEVKLLGCWMHARRRFAEIVKSTKTAGLSHEAINIIGNLYKIEKYIKDNNFTTAQAYEYRLANSKPILDKFKYWLDSNVTEVLPQSPIGKAINYSLNQWSKLITYLDDGRLEIDNGLTERAIKPFVIGRKNWMFSNSVAGAKSSAIIYSVIETCNIHEVEPYAYLRYALEKIPSITTTEELHELLPFVINKNLLAV
jgi:hypothetical protein